MIIGTPRSGTTLTQRLACEIPGVSIPPETHLFSAFAPQLLSRERFPIKGDPLREVIGRYLALPQLGDGRPRLSEVYDLVGGDATTLFDLFQAVVQASAGPSEIYGEKTPEHLLWCPTLAHAVPWLRFVAVVRDPRAVVASLRSVRWSTKNPARSARRWACDQRELLSAMRALGPERILVLRYEDIVQSPDLARTKIALLLGRTSGAGPEPVVASRLFRQNETWKARAVDPVSSDRVHQWKIVLAPLEISQIESICRREMVAFGYLESSLNRQLVPAFDWLERDHYRLRRSWYQNKIRWMWAPRAGF
jgi:hypothetical protein